MKHIKIDDAALVKIGVEQGGLVDELKDWDITLNDGLDNEPYVTKPGFVEKRINQFLEHLANEAFKSVGDEGLFPNHSDKDIWTAGFKVGYLAGMRNERKQTRK